MNVTDILEGIRYVGVNDRATQRFEGLWPLPYGVSYNSYIVEGENATALMDAVEASEFGALCQHLDDNNIETLDYLVVHHMEPDHSGSIPMLVDRFPAMKIVCNKIAAAQIGGFYGIDDPERFHIVAEGDEIDLGGRSLRFIMTPMVHWPETMMTYVEKDAVIFSGDAFGCFGALDGGIVDSQASRLVPYREEMYRYYSNIVGKYGKFVQAALAKVAPLKIEWICSTHGPVWHDKIAEVVDLYDRLSRYESEEGTVIVYGSMYGNTGRLAETIAERLAERGVTDIRVFNASTAEMSDMISACFRYKNLIIGSATYSMQIFPPVETLIRALVTREVKDKKVGLFGSFTWAPGALPKLTAAFGQMGIVPAASLMMKQGMSDALLPDIDKFVDNMLS